MAVKMVARRIRPSIGGTDLGGDRLTGAEGAAVEQIYGNAFLVGPGDEGVDEVIDGAGLGRVGRDVHSFHAGDDAAGAGEIVLDPDSFGGLAGDGLPGRGQTPGNLIVGIGQPKDGDGLVLLLPVPAGQGRLGQITNRGYSGPRSMGFRHDALGVTGALAERGPAPKVADEDQGQIAGFPEPLVQEPIGLLGSRVGSAEEPAAPSVRTRTVDRGEFPAPTFEETGVMTEQENPERGKPPERELEVPGGKRPVDDRSVAGLEGKRDDGDVVLVDKNGQAPISG